jgi:hypothetical protein
MKLFKKRTAVAVLAIAAMAVVFLSIFIAVEYMINRKAPEIVIKPVTSVKVSQGDLWATKTYMNDYVESPDGKKLLYRYFANPSSQPAGRTGKAIGAQMWMCGPDGGSPVKLFDILNVGLWNELGHGSDSMIWIDNDRFYYNGILYQVGKSAVLWKLQNPVDSAVPPNAWSNQVGGKLFVNIRTGSNAGYYWINPLSATEPSLNPVIDAVKMKPYLGGDPSAYQFTYIKLSQGGSYIFFVMYVNGIEYGFTSKADGTEIAPLGNNNNTLLPFNGHTIWFDDARIIYPSYADHTTKTCDRFGSDQVTVAGSSNHITLSPDKKWIATDDGNYTVRLYLLGNNYEVANLMSMETRGVTTDPHPSFSRDSKRVYFTGKYGEKSAAMYYTDVSQWTLNPGFTAAPNGY